MRTANPALNKNTFEFFKNDARYNNKNFKKMTIEGTVNNSFILLFILLITSALTWFYFLQGGFAGVTILMWVGLIVGLVLAIITVFKKEWAPITAPLYAGFEGLAIGGISAFFASMFPGIVLQAIALTFGTMFAMLFIYKMKWIKVTENFKLGLFAATMSVMLIYLATWILSFFSIKIPYIHESGWIGIVFSLIVVVIAALNLVLDFDFIEKGSEQGAPKFMEWYGAFGLMVTLIWLYLELLRLLAKIRGR